MAKIFLDPADSITISNNNVSVFGSTGTESITVAAGVTGTIFDQNTETVLLSGTAASFKYAQAGNQIKVYSSDGVTLVATIPVQGDSDGTVLTFTDGTAQAKLTSGVMTFGGATVGATAASVTPTTFDPTVKTPGTTAAAATFSVAAGAASTTEGGNATFTVTLSAAQGTATTVNYALAGTGGAVLGTDTGTAVVAGTNVTSTATTLTFAPGATTATITVPVTFDTNAETGEGASLTLTSPSAGTSLGTNAVAVTAFADPAAPTFTLTSNAVAGAATTEGNTIIYTITPSGVTDKAYTFTLSTQGDTIGGVANASAGADFSPAASTVTFAAGTSTAQTVVQTVVADGATEGLEGYKTTLLNSSLTAVGTPISGLINDGSVSGTTGTSFSLTTSIDNITGSSADDTIIGDNLTLSATDVINGGLGTDTLSYTDGSSTGLSIAAATITNIENINLRNVNTGSTSVTETSTVTFGALTAGQSYTVNGLTFTANKAVSSTDVAAAFASLPAGATTGSGTANGVYSGTFNTTSYTSGTASGSAVTFTSTVAGSNVNDLAVSGARVASPTALTSGSGITIVQGVAATSDETASVVFTALTNGQSYTLPGLTFTANQTMTAAEVADAFDSLANNATTGLGSGANKGVFTGQLTGWSSIAATGAGLDTVLFTSATTNTNVTDFTVTAGQPALPSTPAQSTTQGVAGGAGATDTIVATNYAGATAFNSNLSTQPVAFTGLAAATQSAGIIGNGVVVNGASSFAFASGTAATLNVSGGTAGAGAVTLTGATVTSATINSTGAANAIGAVALPAVTNALTINATTNLATGNITGFNPALTNSTITVSGAATSVSLGTIEAATVKTINASGLTAGGVTATLPLANTGVNFTGGAGNDVVTANAVLVTGAMVDAAAGTADRLVFTASTNAAAGTDQLQASTAPFYKNFEVVQASASTSDVTLDVTQLAANNTITGVRVSQTGAFDANLQSLNATQAANVAIVLAAPATPATDVITLGLTGALTGGQIDTVKAALTTTTATNTPQNIDLSGIVLTGIEKLELTGTGTIASTTGTITLTTAGATSLDSIKLTTIGDGSVVTVSATHTAQNLNVDGSASSGKLTLNGTAYPAATTTGLTLTGGSNADILLGGSAASTRDNLIGNAGNDILIGEGTATLPTFVGGLGVFVAGGIGANTGSDILTGGAGNDTYGFGATGVTSATAASVLDTIVGLDLGTSVVGGQVDRIYINGTTPAATGASLITFTTGEQATFTAAATFANALDLVTANAAFGLAANNVATFTYGADTYLVVNDTAATTTFVATDTVIKITGVTGTLDVSDIIIV